MQAGQAMGSGGYRVPAISEAVTTQLQLFLATLPQTNNHEEVELARVLMQFHHDET